MLVWSFPRPEKLPLLLPFVQFHSLSEKKIAVFISAPLRSKKAPVSLVALRKSSLKRCRRISLSPPGGSLPLPFPAQVGRAIAVTPTAPNPGSWDWESLRSRASKMISFGPQILREIVITQDRLRTQAGLYTHLAPSG